MALKHDEIIHGGLSLERYASTHAELRHAGAGRRKEVLTSAGLSEAEWDAADRRWKETIEKDFDRADGLLVEFAAHFVQARQRLESAPPPEIGRREDEPPRAAPPPVEVPSFLAVPQPAPGSSRKPSLAGTIDIDVRTIPVLAVPFVRAQGPATAGAQAAPTSWPSGSPTQPNIPPDPAPLSERAPASLAGTANLDLSRVVAAVLPFPGGREPAPPRAPPERAPTLTLEQYASLTAELTASRVSASEVRARYHVPSEEALRELNASWETRFVAEPALRQRWGALVAQYRDWLGRQG